MTRLKQTYAWSESRVKTLRECAWKYYLTYICAWEGWLTSATQEKQRAYTLKNMTNLPMFIGSVVHNTIEDTISIGRRTGEWRTLEQSQDYAVQLLRIGWKQSVEKRWQYSPKKNVNLAEHFYKEDITQEQLTLFKQKAIKSIKAFYDVSLFNVLKNLKKEDWLTLEDFQKFELTDGEEVAVKIDCGFKHGGKVYLLDWKTGRVNDNVIEQLITYSMYALKQGWAKHPDEIVIIPVYLFAYSEIGERAAQHLEVTMQHIQRQAETIRNEYSMLQNAFKNKDNQKYFKHTDNKYACKKCFFRDMCSQAATEIGKDETPF